MRLTTLYILILLLICLFPAALPAETVTASASFTGGLSSSFSFTFVSGPPSVHLEQIEINLSPGTDLHFDTTTQNICCFAGTDVITGLTSFSPTGAALNEQTEVVFNFSSFTPGDVFQFSADVDHPDPTLLPLKNCAGKTGLALTLCNLQNAGITATNDASLLAAETVLPNQIDGAAVTFVFGGPGYNNSSVTGSFRALSVLDLLDGQTSNPANVSTDVVPEPASVVTLGAGLAFLGAIARRKRRSSGRR